jgi:methionine-gamma-lyase
MKGMSDEHSRSGGKSTKAIHAALDKSIHGEASVPIFETSTFSFPSAEEGAGRFSGAKPGYLYTRLGNPTVQALEQTVTELENGFGGIATSSGMAAVTSVYLSLLGRDEHVVSSEVVYGPSRLVLEKDLSRYGVLSSFVDTSNLRNTEDAMGDTTRLVFIETP